MPRPFVGLGHSIGGAQLLHLSLMHYRLFATMVMLKPITGQCINSCGGPTLTKLSTFRRDLWESHEEACRSARKWYRSRDKRVLDRWCECTFRPLPTLASPVGSFEEGVVRPVTLTMTKH
jgi:hypothetical protein